ncbi:MAG: D-alanine--poly(phosphoribitol) ligase subunit DltA [Anaerovoracaceae bacterium]
MLLLEKIKNHAKLHPSRIAMESNGQILTYAELDCKSDIIASWIINNFGTDKTPVVVYGHKSTYMLLCFIGCVKAGRGYCPLDISISQQRAEEIITTVNPPVIFATEDINSICNNNSGEEKFHLGTHTKILDLNMIKDIVDKNEINKELLNSNESIGNPLNWVKGNDTFYILFTSGSTGKPKGVEITADNLINFTKWSSTLVQDKPSVWMNQAPFSFDLSVMDLYTCLFRGDSLWSLNKETQLDISKLFESFNQSQISNWVSTPSFAELCLSDQLFNENLLPQLDTFLFCGEALQNKTAIKLLDRFPKAKVINTYGPTESTVAVTSIEITKELATQVNPLPIGNTKPGTKINIVDEYGNILEDGKEGEIIILGDTVAKGYFRDQNRTEQVFHRDASPSYKTGDKGTWKNGMLYCLGRLDNQIKLHGYRIELGDIENNLLKLPGVNGAACLPKYKDGSIASLTAFVANNDKSKGTYQDRKAIKEGLREFLPEYMVPKKIVFMDSLPMTSNGKIDRKKLSEVV